MNIGKTEVVTLLTTLNFFKIPKCYTYFDLLVEEKMVCLDLMDSQVNQVHEVIAENKDLPVNLVQPAREESLDCQDPMDNLVQQDNAVKMVNLVLLVMQDLRDNLDHKVHKVHLGHPDNQDPEENLEREENLVKMEAQDLMEDQVTFPEGKNILTKLPTLGNRKIFIHSFFE